MKKPITRKSMTRKEWNEYQRNWRIKNLARRRKYEREWWAKRTTKQKLYKNDYMKKAINYLRRIR